MKQENKIQQEIFLHVTRSHQDLIIHSVPNGFGFTIPKTIPGQFHNAIRIAIAMAVKLTILMGMVPGVSDMIIHLPKGKCLMVEVKDEEGIQSPAQIRIEKKLKDLGGDYILVRSLEDFIDQFKNYYNGNHV